MAAGKAYHLKHPLLRTTREDRKAGKRRKRRRSPYIAKPQTPEYLGGAYAAKPGTCTCLRCGKPWQSPDVRRRRICPRCTELSDMAEYSSRQRAYE